MSWRKKGQKKSAEVARPVLAALERVEDAAVVVGGTAAPWALPVLTAAKKLTRAQRAVLLSPEALAEVSPKGKPKAKAAKPQSSRGASAPRGEGAKQLRLGHGTHGPLVWTWRTDTGVPRDMTYRRGSLARQVERLREVGFTEAAVRRVVRAFVEKGNTYDDVRDAVEGDALELWGTV